MEVGLWLWGVGVGVVCDNPCLILVFDVVTHKDVLGLRGMASTYEIGFFSISAISNFRMRRM